MSRQKLYQEDTTTVSVVLPVSIKGRMQEVAQSQHRSVSQVVTIILRSYLQEHGELPEKVS